MKKTIKAMLLCFLAVQFMACKQEGKKEESKPVVVEKSFSHAISKAENNINFVAYKTTEKVPVKGMFKKIEITKGGEGNSIKEAMNGAEFTIPVSSIETNDSGRNVKIREFFFKVMANSFNLTGTLDIKDDTSGVVAFTMNGITKDLPFTYVIADNTFTMKTVMNIDVWNGQAAIASLNGACKELHKGADGVSKTWNEVAIEVVSKF